MGGPPHFARPVKGSRVIGQTISHYRITAELCRGGMGVVYEAENTRLQQPVALKFLPAELTDDAASKTRFVHEAQAASSLKHHHVCTILRQRSSVQRSNSQFHCFRII